MKHVHESKERVSTLPADENVMGGLSLHMRTILVADDEEDLRTLVQMTLESPDYRILEASDGDSALALIDREKPDLVILDWMMPGKNGVDIIRTLRANASTQHLPVIMLTAKGVQDQEELQALTIFGYLRKPFSPLQLLETVHRALG